MNSVEVFRESLKNLPQVAAHNATEIPDLRTIFTPKSHERALDPTCEIIVGDRGVGKSYWSSVLKDDAARAAISPIYPKLQLNKVRVCLGFSEVLGRPEHPSDRVITSLLEEFSDPTIIWRAVILNSVSESFLPSKWKEGLWKEKCGWIKNNSEKEEAILMNFNNGLNQKDQTHLIIFDALDRLGKDWHTIRVLSKSLLAVVLQLRSFNRIRAKLFIRPDMEGDREIWSFRDGSKLKQNIVYLDWQVRDLYGFVWHWFLCDPDARSHFVGLCKKNCKVNIVVAQGENLIKVPDELLDNESNQKDIIESLAGSMMGGGSRKGHPYTWIPKHLADAKSLTRN